MPLPDDKDGIGGIGAGGGFGGLGAGGVAGVAAGGRAGVSRGGAPGDGGDAGGAEGAEPLVWLEDGVEQPFEAMTELRRPWLEESSSWGSGADVRRGLPDEEDGGPKDLIWL